MKTIKPIVAVMSCWLISGCNGFENQLGDAPYGFSVLEKGSYSAISSERFGVFRDQDSFKAMWIEHHAAVSAEMPALDFQKYMVLGAFAGTKPSGGYNLEITKIEENQDYLEVMLLLTQPDYNCFVSSVLTQPYVIVATQVSDKLVKFKVSTQINKCD